MLLILIKNSLPLKNWLIYLLLITAQIVSSTIANAADVQYSKLWGKHGELWNSNSQLHDFSEAGYRQGNEPIPDWPVRVNVEQYGAYGNDTEDDTQAIQDALDNCPENGAVFIPKGKYIITNKIYHRRDNVVLRGEDMYDTILYFPKGLQEVTEDNVFNFGQRDAFLHVERTGDGTHRGLENFTMEFIERQYGGHYSNFGANAMAINGVTDSWIRNICIKNADNGILAAAWRNKHVTIMDIEFDYFNGRIKTDEYNGTVGHQGIKVKDGSYNLVHNIKFKGTGDYIHTIYTGGSSAVRNVFSRISGSNSQLDYHSGGASENLWTEIDVGKGQDRTGRPIFRGQGIDAVFWNINSQIELGYRYIWRSGKSGDQWGGPDEAERNVVVGLKVNPDEHPSVTDSSENWRETIEPSALEPQNIYLAQMAYRNKAHPTGLKGEAGPDQILTDSNGNGSEPVALDGSASSSNESNIVSYNWQIEDNSIATGVTPTIPLPIGTHTIALVITDNNGDSYRDTVEITVEAENPDNPGTNNTFAQWSEAMGLSGTAASPDADPNKNGIPNLMEYALNFDPTLMNKVPTPTIDTYNDGFEKWVTFNWRYNKKAADLTYTVQYSDDLSEWFPVNIDGQNFIQTLMDDNQTTSLFETKVKITNQNNYFLRLQVMLNNN